eukprot:scaffold50_cov420-Prasinococcus_capsulatus_cf.AAC.23
MKDIQQAVALEPSNKALKTFMQDLQERAHQSAHIACLRAEAASARTDSSVSGAKARAGLARTEDLTSDLKDVGEELVRGREVAAKLRPVLAELKCLLQDEDCAQLFHHNGGIPVM